MAMKSCIYEGWVRHARYAPVRNAFRYSLFFMYLDLAELETVFRGRWFWSSKGFNIAYLRRQDHFGDPAIPLDAAVRDLVQQKTGKRPDGPIRMLTHLRYFGHNFNPATFYYCYDHEDRRVECTIVEIHNTPWGEVFCYVLDESRNQGTPEKKRFQFPKSFHVSPFMDMTIDYDWTFVEPSEKLNVHMINYNRETKVFESELTLSRREINSRTLALMLLKYPLITVKVIVGLYWQAFKLRVKGATFYTHPQKQKTEDTGDA
jgi:DUF1365 family protein